MENIKTLISPIRSIWDRDDQWLPPGNYFFTVKKLKNKYVMGTVTHEEGFNSDFEFTINEFIKMMAASQAGLARKANFFHDEVPKYPSPPTSPARHMPNNFVEKQYEDEQSCAICFEKVKKETDIYYCKKALNCAHQFHRRCLIPWIRTNDTCPVCRKKKKIRRNVISRETNNGSNRYSQTLVERLSERLGFNSPLYDRSEFLGVLRGSRNRRETSNYVIQNEEDA